jgi:hypothetical protein
MKFPEVAAQYSEDKARQGVWIYSYRHKPEILLNHLYHNSFVFSESLMFVSEYYKIYLWAWYNQNPTELNWSEPVLCCAKKKKKKDTFPSSAESLLFLFVPTSTRTVFLPCKTISWITNMSEVNIML